MPAACWKEPELAGGKCRLFYIGSMGQRANILCLTNNTGQSSPKPFLFVFGIGNSELDHAGNH